METPSPEWKCTKTQRGGPPDCATKHRPSRPRLPNYRKFTRTPQIQQIQNGIEQNSVIPEYEHRNSKTQSHPNPIHRNSKIQSYPQTRPPKTKKFNHIPNPTHRNPTTQPYPKPTRRFQKSRPWNPGPTKKSAIFKSPSWDLSRTFLKPESPKTQIRGDGDSRRPRRPRRTTTHTHERRSGLLSAEAAEILLYRFRAPRSAIMHR